MITCDECGKVKGEGDVGEHWVCDSCRITESKPEDKQDKFEPVKT